MSDHLIQTSQCSPLWLSHGKGSRTLYLIKKVPNVNTVASLRVIHPTEKKLVHITVSVTHAGTPEELNEYAHRLLHAAVTMSP